MHICLCTCMYNKSATHVSILQVGHFSHPWNDHTWEEGAREGQRRGRDQTEVGRLAYYGVLSVSKLPDINRYLIHAYASDLYRSESTLRHF